MARFLEVLRQANGIIAGITDMLWRRFMAFNALGATLWVGLWTSLGYLAGNHVTIVYDTARRYEIYLALAAGLVILVVIARHLLRRRAASRPTHRDTACADPPERRSATRSDQHEA